MTEEQAGTSATEAGDDDAFDDAAEDRMRRGYLRPDPGVFVGVLPSVVFLILNSVASTQIAIVVSLVVAAAVLIRNPGSGVIRALTIMSFGVVFASAMVGLALDSGKAFVAQNMVGDFLIAAVFTVSAFIGRPMVGAIAREMVPAIKQMMPLNHPVFIKTTLLTAAANIISGVLRLYLLDVLSENQYVIVSRVLGFPLAVAVFAYSYREITRVAIRIWPADMPPPPQWRAARR